MLSKNAVARPTPSPQPPPLVSAMESPRPAKHCSACCLRRIVSTATTRAYYPHSDDGWPRRHVSGWRGVISSHRLRQSQKCIALWYSIGYATNLIDWRIPSDTRPVREKKTSIANRGKLSSRCTLLHILCRCRRMGLFKTSSMLRSGFPSFRDGRCPLHRDFSDFAHPPALQASRCHDVTTWRIHYPELSPAAEAPLKKEVAGSLFSTTRPPSLCTRSTTLPYSAPAPQNRRSASTNAGTRMESMLQLAQDVFDATGTPALAMYLDVQVQYLQLLQPARDSQPTTPARPASLS